MGDIFLIVFLITIGAIGLYLTRDKRNNNKGNVKVTK